MGNDGSIASDWSTSTVTSNGFCSSSVAWNGSSTNACTFTSNGRSASNGSPTAFTWNGFGSSAFTENGCSSSTSNSFCVQWTASFPSNGQSPVARFTAAPNASSYRSSIDQKQKEKDIETICFGSSTYSEKCSTSNALRVQWTASFTSNGIRSTTTCTTFTSWISRKGQF